MKKTIAIIALLITFALLFTACGGKEETAPSEAQKETETVTPDTTAAPETTEAPDTTEEVTEAPAVERPSADGQLVEAYDLTFYLPANLTPNEWNGMLGVYEFYTGEYSGTRPAGLDFSLSVSADSNADGDLEAYARDASEKAAGAAVEPETVEINGTEWLRFAVDEGHVNFYTIFNEGLYEITTSVGGDSQENFDSALAMLEETLFLAPVEY
ncbi:MAG: hypothetical protein IJT70_07865 [Clostridia bacterium]|nr:hypothetical protein [Clostridia bacterium]